MANTSEIDKTIGLAMAMAMAKHAEQSIECNAGIRRVAGLGGNGRKTEAKASQARLCARFLIL